MAAVLTFEFESNQSGIETLQKSSSKSSLIFGLNRTRVELKRLSSFSSAASTRVFESNQSGIETALLCKRGGRRVAFESNQSGIETSTILTLVETVSDRLNRTRVELKLRQQIL